MVHCLRTALLMVFLIGLVQGLPFKKLDLGFKFLTKDVSCNNSVTFQSPTNVMKPCFNAALTIIKNELEHAKNNCTGKLYRLDQTLDVLDDVKIPTEGIQSSDCQWERKTFDELVKDFENFTENVNSQLK